MSPPADADYAKTLRDAALRRVVDDLVQEKINGGSSDRARRVSYKAKLESLAAMGVTITVEALYMRVMRQYQMTRNDPSLRDGAVAGAGKGGADCPLDEVDVDGDARSDVSSLPSATSEQLRRLAALKKKEDHARLKECLTAVALDFAAEKAKRAAIGKRVPKGLLSQLIKARRAEFGVAGRIPEETVRSRIVRMKDVGDGVPGPAASADPVIAKAESLAAAAEQMEASARAMAASARTAAESARTMAEAAAKADEEAKELARLAARGRREARSLLRKLGGDERQYAIEGKDAGVCKKRKRAAVAVGGAAAVATPINEDSSPVFSNAGNLKGYVV